MYPRYLFWGTESRYSLEVLRVLLTERVSPSGVVLFASPQLQKAPIRLQTPSSRPSPLPLAAGSVSDLASQQYLPVWTVSDLSHRDSLAQIAALAPDVACVACFPKRLPTEMLEIPTHGFLNVHPSLLPAYRGPVPMFWQFRDGVTRSGVTIHKMDRSFDTGGILVQAPLVLPLGLSGPDADFRSARLGGALLAQVMGKYCAGEMQTTPQLGTGHSQPWPSADDFVLSLRWPASRAFHFMRGTAEWGHPYLVQDGATEARLKTALSWYDGELESTFQSQNGVMEIQFSSGVLVAS